MVKNSKEEDTAKTVRQKTNGKNCVRKKTNGKGCEEEDKW